MAQYDPQRSRSRHRNGEEQGPAPVDALLGPTEPSVETSPPAADRAGGGPGLIDLTDSAPSATGAVPAANGSSPAPDLGRPPGGLPATSPVRPVLVVLALVAALALGWAWLRRRRPPVEPE